MNKPSEEEFVKSMVARERKHWELELLVVLTGIHGHSVAEAQEMMKNICYDNIQDYHNLYKELYNGL